MQNPLYFFYYLLKLDFKSNISHFQVDYNASGLCKLLKNKAIKILSFCTVKDNDSFCYRHYTAPQGVNIVA